MPKITRVEILQVDLKPHVARSDAIQTFSMQETPMLRVFCDDGAEGTGRGAEDSDAVCGAGEEYGDGREGDCRGPEDSDTGCGTGEE